MNKKKAEFKHSICVGGCVCGWKGGGAMKIRTNEDDVETANSVFFRICLHDTNLVSSIF